MVLLHEPGDELVGLRRKPQIGLCLLEGRKILKRLGGPARDALEVVGLVPDGEHGQGEPPRAGQM